MKKLLATWFLRVEITSKQREGEKKVAEQYFASKLTEATRAL